MTNNSALVAGSILENRYRIVRELGHGGFGRTYLAEDMNRFSESCVLKEFAPQVQGANELRKAQELFEREAGMLYKLQHPQVPRFRELIRVRNASRESLFLVQDYVEGPTYYQLLKSRKRLSETEVIQLLIQLLPVLEYVHSQGVVHRDISPDNLILRTADRLPVLIDFGAVKQIAASALSQYTQQPAGTSVGKEGYAPDEQMRQGKAFPCSDLYALAVTVLVLLSGKDPKDLYDSVNATWRWRNEVSVSPQLGAVLDRMLSYRPRDRYQSAREVIGALPGGAYTVPTSPFVPVNPTPTPVYYTPPAPQPAVPVNPKPGQVPANANFSTLATQIVARALGRNVPNPTGISNSQLIWRQRGSFAKGIGVVLVPGIIIAFLVQSVVSVVKLPALPKLPELPKFPEIPKLPNAPKLPGTSMSKTELARQEKIGERRKKLKIDRAVFYPKVDELFYRRHPELKGRALSDKPEDTRLREEWMRVAEDLLDRLERGQTKL
ncbi:serine/threonine-protein kinase [Kamptonema formosum]|uniref:serine/threonine-protein kinase n=1 Tax=Kamptonema formosum TaxID=331992 RepID=UPI0003485994|nr:serine/threonine-protein kinase [Oscillatoria sp. PCC 10802]